MSTSPGNLEADLKGNSTLKIYRLKWTYMINEFIYWSLNSLTIKLLISHHLFIRGGGSSTPSSLFFISMFICWCWHGYQKQLCICSIVLACVKTCIVFTVWQEIPQWLDPHLQPLSIRNAFINSRFSTVNGAIIYAPVTSFLHKNE